MLSFVKKILSSNEREIRRFQKFVTAINHLEPEIQKLSDETLRNKTVEFKERISRGESLDKLLIESFAVVREAARRSVGMRPFDAQLIGAMVLHEGRIAEMKTGEGKTLAAVPAVYLNSLTGKGVHVVTVNDYLAKRDANWMGPIYQALGLSFGFIQHFMEPPERQEAYLCDVTYVTNNEIGFDYLRDNMVVSLDQCVLRELNYAIVDEVDSILIDEARTPLIISGVAEESTDQYIRFAQIAKQLQKESDYTVDEKAHSVPLTESGVSKTETLLKISNLYGDENIELLHHVNAALKAKELFKRDVDYIVKEGEIIIVDEFTGRLMYGRRYSDGLHQAIEAKEGVKVKQEDQTLATITFQNFFRLYKKLAGMTGTAATEETEFQKIYDLDVLVIPTHRPMVRKDHPDLVYRTEKAKFEAIVQEVETWHKQGRPVLVGTRSIEKSEILSQMLKKRGIPHQVLNAKYHEKEAEIIAQAGRHKMVTIATNMAGRGVDIILGGNPPDPETQKTVKELNGLHIIGTERHESRRIDNQLRGRSGRQGDPGSTRFYVSLEDELMRLFGSDRISGLLQKFGMDEDIPIEHGLITRAIENAQAKVEGQHFEMRKNVLDYDDVMNQQREVIYSERRKILEGIPLLPHIQEMIKSVIDRITPEYVHSEMRTEEWDIDGLWKAINEIIPLSSSKLTKSAIEELKNKGEPAKKIQAAIHEAALQAYKNKEDSVGSEVMRDLERHVLLYVIDTKWIDHLRNMDHLREGIGLRAYGQKDPKVEYINEAYEMFESLKSSIEEDTVQYLYQIQVQNPTEEMYEPVYHVTGMNRGEDGETRKPLVREQKVGRNEPCPCGSGLKYKKCHGREVKSSV
ncbi:MAG: preprotein translocase subunit SecA [Candidatus Eremiobacteraeota bacterium]|nr:preprotein translocase subunit SecA [Candidatus Eremiobacteraeota bacterium]MCL5054848.1 preprotein translocase subunit SecA [Bacillota bacterium]